MPCRGLPQLPRSPARWRAALAASTPDRRAPAAASFPALNPSDATFEIVRTAPLGSGDGVRVEYRARVPDGPSRNRFLECRFAGGSRASPDRGALLGVTTDTGPLGELRLQLLKRFWLEAEGAAADPEPVPGATLAPAVPRALAIGLQHALFALPPVAIYALLAAAYALVYGLVGRINLAFGELAAVSGYAAFLGFAIAGRGSGVAVPLLFALMLALGAGLAYGVATGRFVFAPLMRQTGQRVLIGTIALGDRAAGGPAPGAGVPAHVGAADAECALCGCARGRLRGDGDAHGAGGGLALPAGRAGAARAHALEPVRPRLARVR